MFRRLLLSLWLIGATWPVEAAPDRDLQFLGKIVDAVCSAQVRGIALNLIYYLRRQFWD
jgi:hypothetical protein